MSSPMMKVPYPGSSYFQFVSYSDLPRFIPTRGSPPQVAKGTTGKKKSDTEAHRADRGMRKVVDRSLFVSGPLWCQ